MRGGTGVAAGVLRLVTLGVTQEIRSRIQCEVATTTITATIPGTWEVRRGPTAVLGLPH